MREALRRIEQLGVTSTLPAVRARLKSEGSRAVQGARSRALATLGSAELLEEVYPTWIIPTPASDKARWWGCCAAGFGRGAGRLRSPERIGQSSPPEPARREFAAQNGLCATAFTTFIGLC
ncbi:MAG: hypothetical protein U0401_27285 [Anaerolineae bacterium]